MAEKQTKKQRQADQFSSLADIMNQAKADIENVKPAEEPIEVSYTMETVEQPKTDKKKSAGTPRKEGKSKAKLDLMNLPKDNRKVRICITIDQEIQDTIAEAMKNAGMKNASAVYNTLLRRACGLDE